jgi:hypothetical protein
MSLLEVDLPGTARWSQSDSTAIGFDSGGVQDGGDSGGVQDGGVIKDGWREFHELDDLLRDFRSDGLDRASYNCVEHTAVYPEA